MAQAFLIILRGLMIIGDASQMPTKPCITLQIIRTAQAITKKKVSIKPLKELALKLAKDSILRQVLLVEPEEIEAEEFLVKIATWLRLQRLLLMKSSQSGGDK